MDPDLRDRWLRLAHERISAAGLRTGAARERVMECLARDAQCLIGVQELLDRVRDGGRAASQASVYRVLEELQRLGLVHRHQSPSGAAAYEIAVPGRHHHHLVDAESGDVEPFHDPALEAAIADAARRLGVRMVAHEIVITGRRERTGAAPSPRLRGAPDAPSRGSRDGHRHG